MCFHLTVQCYSTKRTIQMPIPLTVIGSTSLERVQDGRMNTNSSPQTSNIFSLVMQDIPGEFIAYIYLYYIATCVSSSKGDTQRRYSDKNF